MSPLMPWAIKIDAVKLKRQNEELIAKLIRTRAALEVSERRRLGMEIILTARLTRICELSGKLDQLRAQNKRLDAAERLVEMVKLTPPGAAAMPAPK